MSTDREQIEQGKAALQYLPMVPAPESIWPSLEAALRERPSPKPLRWWRPVFAVLAVAAIFAIIAYRPHTTWELKTSRGLAHIGPGEWIETGSSTATLKIGTIGTVDVEIGRAHV